MCCRGDDQHHATLFTCFKTPFAVSRTMWSIHLVVTPLAHHHQVIVVTILRRVIEVRDRQHDTAAGDRMRLVVDGVAASTVIVAALADALTPTASTLKPDAL